MIKKFVMPKKLTKGQSWNESCAAAEMWHKEIIAAEGQTMSLVASITSVLSANVWKEEKDGKPVIKTEIRLLLDAELPQYRRNSNKEFISVATNELKITAAAIKAACNSTIARAISAAAISTEDSYYYDKSLLNFALEGAKVKVEYSFVKTGEYIPGTILESEHDYIARKVVIIEADELKESALLSEQQTEDEAKRASIREARIKALKERLAK